ncbi:MAG: hypothetical protein CMD83_11325 [Gammaproteobacteria bacterium]|nr:hypothetical protein [Gammaproteobacteria bacterium]
MQEAAVLESSLRLLCVTGDEQGVRRVVDEIPAPTFSVEYASRYRDALAAIGTGRYDGCITDFMMRRGTALELLHVHASCRVLRPRDRHHRGVRPSAGSQYLPLGVTEFIDREVLSGQTLERAVRYGARSKERERKLSEGSRKTARNLRLVVQELRTPLNAIIGFTNYAIPRVRPLVEERDTRALQTVLELRTTA